MIINTLNGLDRFPRVYRKVGAHGIVWAERDRRLLIELPYAFPISSPGVKLAVA